MPTAAPTLDERHDVGAPPPVENYAQEEPEHRKISMNLRTTDYVELRKWATDEGTSISEIIRRGLVLLRFLVTEQLRGSSIVIQTPKGEKDQVLRPLRSSPGLTDER